MPEDPLRIVRAEFVAGAGPGSSLPAPSTAEIAFAGRSNVGKSSLINALVDRKNLVRTSSTPGSTRQVNLYEAQAADGARFHLVDLPGYGFTKRSKSEQLAWSKLIEGYLRERVTLGALVLLADVRRGLEEDDLELLEFVRDTGPRSARRAVETILVATKIDKLVKSERKPALEEFKRRASQARPGVGGRVVAFSSETGEGKKELWRAIRSIVLAAAHPG